MNLKEYIKNINAYLIAEDFDEGTSETMDDKVKQLQDLKARFEAFLKKIEEAGLTLEEIQKAAAEQGGDTGEATPAPPSAPSNEQPQAAPAQPQAAPAQPQVQG